MRQLDYPWLLRALALVLALALATPIVHGVATARPAVLSALYGRQIATLPTAEQALANPWQALSQSLAYLSDRTAWVFASSRIVDRVRYDWLGDAASSKLVRNGAFVFLARLADTGPLHVIESACLYGPRAGPDHLIEQSLTVHGALARPDRRVSFLVIPSKPLLYAERLPVAVPKALRAHCRTTLDTNPLFRPWQEALAEAGVVGVFPLERMRGAREQSGYYPAENFHAEGASAFDAAQALLARLYPDEPMLQAPLKRVRARADLEFILRHPRWIERLEPDYGARRARPDRERARALAAAHPELRGAQVFTAEGEGRAVVIGSSFSTYLAPHLAVRFGETIRVNIEALPVAEHARALGPVLDALDADEVIFVHHDTGIIDGGYGILTNALTR